VQAPPSLPREHMAKAQKAQDAVLGALSSKAAEVQAMLGRAQNKP